MSGRITFNGQLSLSPHGGLACSLFPIKDAGYTNCDDESLMELFRDMWRFFHSKKRSGKVHGRTVRKVVTPVQKLKMMEFRAGFMKFTMIESNRDPNRRVTMILELPWASQVDYNDGED